MANPLSVLVLGGTSWLGGSVARHAQAAGHAVTALARGDSGSAPPGVAWVRADRDHPATAYDEVVGRGWDVVIDVARQPLHVRGALEALAGRGEHWIFVSTCSVYADDSTPGQDESAALHEPWAGEGLAPDEEYGPAKVACEQAVLTAHPDALVARSGLIVGAGDRSDRFGYWPARFARAGAAEPILLPPRDHRLQVVDVEDFGAWLVRCAEERTGGVLNVMGAPTTLGALFEACAEATPGTAQLVEASDAWLAAAGVEPWMGTDSLPLWLPHPEYAGFMSRDARAAEAAGLRHRPLVQVVADSLAWERDQGLDRARRAGLTATAERDLLARLHGL